MTTKIPWGRFGRGVIAGGLGLLCLGLVSCGRSESADQRVPSMIGPSATPKKTPSGPNQAPRIETVEIKPARPAPGRRVEAVVRTSDPDGDRTRLAYRWQTPGGRLLGDGRSFDTSGMDTGSRLELVVIARDGELESEPATHRFRLADASAEIALVVIDTSNGTEPGDVLKAVVEVSGGTGRGARERIEWRVNGEVVGEDEELDTAPFSPGDVVVARARVEVDGARSRAVSSRPVALGRGKAPEIVSKPEEAIDDGVFRYRMLARSPVAGAKLVFELLEGPEGMKVDETSGLVEWSPTSDQRGQFKVEVAVRDQWGSGAAQSFAVRADAPSAPPASAR